MTATNFNDTAKVGMYAINDKLYLFNNSVAFVVGAWHWVTFCFPWCAGYVNGDELIEVTPKAIR